MALTASQLQTLIDNIRLEIGHSFQGGDCITTVKLKPEQVEYLDEIIAALEVEGRTFKFDEATLTLTINSCACPEPDRD